MAPNNQNGYHPATESARAILRRQLMPIPVPFGEKNPNRPEWEHERYSEVNIERAFGGQCNIGVRVGREHDGLLPFADGDLDTLEAVRAAPFYLLPTGMKWGHDLKPCSHWGYYLDSEKDAAHKKFRDPTLPQDADNATLCELRWTGHTIVPYSQWHAKDDPHDTEWVRWEPDGDGTPATVTYADLLAAISRVAAVALLARYWTHGIRHDAALPLAGLLAHGGMSESGAVTLMRALCTAACDTEVDDRMRCVTDTYTKLAAGQHVTGAPTLTQYLDERIVTALRSWLGLGSGLPRIAAFGRPHRDIEAQSRQALEDHQRELSDTERLYTQGGRLVWVRETHTKDDAVYPRMEPVPSAGLATELSRSADYTGKKASHVFVPTPVLNALMVSRDWTLPDLRVVTGTPIVHADGSVHAMRGYDAVTHALYWPRTPLVLPAIPACPTEAEAVVARDALMEPFAQFPFLTDEDRANDLAFTLTLLLRRALVGYIPLFAVNAPDISYGKSLNVEAMYAIASGVQPISASAPTDEAEWSKQIASWLGEGRDLIFLNNVEHPIATDNLELVLTAAEFSRRNMARLNDAIVPNEAVWAATGCNLEFRGALVRRVVRINFGSLNAPTERKSSEFTHPRLLDYIKRERGRLLAAAYTIYRYWLARGKPLPSHSRELPSFEEWSAALGGMLELVGVSSFLLTAHEQMAAMDPTRGEWDAFLSALGAQLGGEQFAAKDIWARVNKTLGISNPLFDVDMRDMLPSELAGALRDEGAFLKVCGRALAKRAGRTFDGWRLDLIPKGKRGNCYILRRMQMPMTA